MNDKWPGGRLALLNSPRNRLLLFVIASRLSGGIFAVALPWIIYDMTHSALEGGIAYAYQTLPLALLFPFAGWIADAARRTRLLTVIESLRFVMMVALWLAFVKRWEGFVHYLLVAALLQGAIQSLYTASMHGMIRDVVPTSHLARTNGLIQFWGFGAAMVGPVLASFFLAHSNPSLTFIMPPLLSLAMILLQLSIPEQTLDGPRRKRVFLLEGFRLILQARLILVMAVVSLFTNLTAGTLGALLVYEVRERGLNDWQTALALSTGTASMMLVGLIAHRLTQGYSSRWIVGGCIALVGIGVSVVSYRSHWLLLVGALFLANGPVSVYNVLLQTYVQKRIPRESLGRVGGAIGCIATASIPLAGWLSGVVAELVGLPLTILSVGLLTIAVGLIGAWATPTSG